MGHSQGGGVAWAVAEALAVANQHDDDRFEDLAAGYKGSIPGSPTTKIFDSFPSFIVPPVALAAKSIFPSFQLSDWLTPLGVARMELAKQIEAGVGALQILLLSPQNDIVRPDYKNATWYADIFSTLGDAGHTKFKGPMLVLQEMVDIWIPYNVTLHTVNGLATKFQHQGLDLEFLVAPDVGRVPMLDATRHIWLQWIQDRLEDKPLKKKGVFTTKLTSLLSSEHYVHNKTWFPLWTGLPQYSYEVALPV